MARLGIAYRSRLAARWRGEPMYRFFLKLIRRRKLQRELDAELAFHREMAAASGNAVPFGNASILREQALDLWRFTTLENLWRDVVYGVRGLRRNPVLVC